MVAQSCSAYKHLASQNLSTGTNLADNLLQLNRISQAPENPSSEDINVVSDILFNFLPKVVTALSDDITNLLGFGLELRAKLPKEIFDDFQGTLNSNSDFVQQIGKAARELKLEKETTDTLHTVQPQNIGREIQDERTRNGKFEMFYPYFPKEREINLDSVKESFKRLAQKFTKFDFNFDKDLEQLKQGITQGFSDTSKTIDFIKDKFMVVLLESLKRLDCTCQYLLKIRNKLPENFTDEFKKSHTKDNTFKLQALGAYAYRLFTDPRKVLKQ